MIDVTLDHVPRSAKKVTILATRPTIESNLYQKRLEQAHVNYILEPAWQQKVDEMIFSIKTSAHSERALSIWEDLSTHFGDAGIDTILLACTDLNALFKTVHSPFRIIDSSRCLADAVVKKWKELS
jgi:aspartate racemase